MRIKLRPHIVSNTNYTCQIVAHTQQYKRTAWSSRANTTPVPYIQQNEDQRIVVMHRHCSVFGRTARKGEMITTIYCIHRTSITRAHTRSNTNVRAVCPATMRHPFHTFNQRRLAQSRQHHCNVFGQRVRVRLRPHTASKQHQ